MIDQWFQRLLTGALAGLALAFLLVSAGSAAPPSKAEVTISSSGPVLEFQEGDYVLLEGKAPPVSQWSSLGGWAPSATPNIYRQVETRWRWGDIHTLIGRFSFDRASLRDGPFAIYTAGSRKNITIYLNGIEVFRNFSGPSEIKTTWYRPYLVPLPQEAVNPGMNEILIQATSEESVGVGRVVVGPHQVLEQLHDSQYFWRIEAPMAASTASLILGLFAFLLWLARREETELLYLAAATALYFLRNYHYFAENVPFEASLFFALTVSGTLTGMVATFGFFMALLKVPNFQAIMNVLIVAVIPYVFFHWVLQLPNMMLYVPTLLLNLWALWYGVRSLMQAVTATKIAWVLVMVTMLGFGIHDSVLAGTGHVWSGNGFYLAVFNGFLFCVAFLFVFGLRAMQAFNDLASANVTLERRIAETREKLSQSEASRQQLLVASAIADERERLLREMHDGIGSNLITALAVAQQQSQPPETIKTLKRALSDLKITVDSLEPIDGDLVLLLGSLRHRLARDLRESGLACRWSVENCERLEWLDAVNALHVLRIFQEAIGNVLTHAKATEIEIGCHPEQRDGVAGILAFVSDDGTGFASGQQERAGKGLSNMRARAAALHGSLSIDSNARRGTRVSLWLPEQRP